VPVAVNGERHFVLLLRIASGRKFDISRARDILSLICARDLRQGGDQTFRL